MSLGVVFIENLYLYLWIYHKWLFKRNQLENGVEKIYVISLQVFRKLFKTRFNIEFHLPKKDKCKICEVRKNKDFKETEETKQLYEKHLEHKNICRDSFLTDQKRAVSDEKFLCVSFDLQKVLNTPHGDNLLLYYARKCANYNLTVYESGIQNGFCYFKTNIGKWKLALFEMSYQKPIKKTEAMDTKIKFLWIG